MKLPKILLTLLIVSVLQVTAVKLFDGTKTFPLKFVTIGAVDNEYELEKKEENKRFHFQMELAVTTDTSSKPYPNPKYKFTPDTAVSDVLQGLKTANDWGMQCAGEEETNCSVEDPENTQEGEIHGHSFTYVEGSTQFSLGPRKPEFDSPAMPIKLLTAPEKEDWEYGEAGVLGLSPKSSFWTYLWEQYLPVKDSFGFSFNLKTAKTNHWYQLFEGREGHTEGVFKGSELKISEVPGDLRDWDEPLNWVEGLESHWGIKHAKLYISSNTTVPVHLGQACITSSAKATILSNQAEKLRKEVFNQNCGYDDCGAYTKTTKAPEFYLTFEDREGRHHNLTIGTTEYIYKKEHGGLAASIEDISEHSGKACPEGASFGLGRMFLFSKLLVMKLERNGTNSIHFGNYSERPNLAEAENVGNMVKVSLGLILFTLIYLTYLRSSGDSGTIVNKIIQSAPKQDEAEGLVENEGVELTGAAA